MSGYAPAANRPASTPGRIRRRVVICFLAALIALFQGNWLPSGDIFGQHDRPSSGVMVNGMRFNPECRGRGPSTVIVVGSPVVATVIDAAAQADIARSVNICTLNVVEGAARHETPGITDILTAVLAEGHLTGPYVLIANASASTVSGWVAGALAAQFVGFVLIDPPNQPAVFEVGATGEQRPLPTGDRDDMVLAILSLFWPPDES
jgi:hypothetical protein